MIRVWAAFGRLLCYSIATLDVLLILEHNGKLNQREFISLAVQRGEHKKEESPQQRATKAASNPTVNTVDF